MRTYWYIKSEGAEWAVEEVAFPIDPGSARAVRLTVQRFAGIKSLSAAKAVLCLRQKGL